MFRIVYACAVAALLAGTAIVASDVDSKADRMAASPQLAFLTALQR